MESWKIYDLRKMKKEPADGSVIPKDYAKVKVIRAAVCPTDLAVYNGKMGKFPTTPCRIAAGLISESSENTLKKGQRVLLSPYCRYNKDNGKIHGVDLDGYLADYTILPISDIYTMPEGMKDEAIPFVDDIAMALKMHEKLNIQKTEYVLIYGASSVNIIFAQLCIYYQAIPILIDNDTSRLEIASDLGVYYQIDTSQEELAGKLKEITSGKPADYLVIDTDCYPQIDDTLLYVRNEGKVGIYGFNTSIEQLKGDLSPIINRNLTIFGLNNGSGEIETAVNMLATEIVKIDGLIEKIVDIEEAPDTFYELASKNNFFKTIIKC